jgi:hypothetical protein
MFNVWVDGHELAWAREAWGHLHPAGLAGEETVLEVTAAKLEPIGLGILAASAGAGELKEMVDANELLEIALIAALDCQRQEVFECLWQTRPNTEEGEESEPTARTGAALQYVMNGFQQG